MIRPSPQLRLRAPFCEDCTALPLCVAHHTADACTDEGELSATFHPRTPGIAAHLARLGGLSLNVGGDTPELALPPFISRVELHGVGIGTRSSAVALSLRDLPQDPTKIVKAFRNVRRRVNLEPSGKVLLFGCGTDDMVERCYERFLEVAGQLASCRFAAVSGLGFSVYYHRPPLESLINIKRNIWTFSHLSRRGVCSFPMLSWRYAADVHRLAGWLWRNRKIELVGVDFEDAKGKVSWARLFAGFRELVPIAPPDVRFIAYGVASEARINKLASVTDRLHVVNAQPFMKATKGIAPPSWKGSPRAAKARLYRAWVDHFNRVVGCAITRRPAAA